MWSLHVYSSHVHLRSLSQALVSSFIKFWQNHIHFLFKTVLRAMIIELAQGGTSDHYTDRLHCISIFLFMHCMQIQDDWPNALANARTDSWTGHSEDNIHLPHGRTGSVWKNSDLLQVSKDNLLLGKWERGTSSTHCKQLRVELQKIKIANSTLSNFINYRRTHQSLF